MITRQHTQELLSRAHLFASAAKAGYNVSYREFDYGVDYTVHSVGIDPETGKRKEDGFKFDLQLKSTVDWRFRGESVVYALDAGTLNAMIGRHRLAPMFLTLLCLPRDEAAWLDSAEEDTTLRHCCYWYDARKDQRTTNPTTQTIDIPRRNLLTPDGLKTLMGLARGMPSRRRRE
ncbi:DUF4365 domain-containing protein [Lichenibacterium ramalinae]|uniref:DUF4365 domain-containing protein n=1 Tax=Lichenibacterium ramalinae TaxID=2316527 RepID=UPI0013EDAB09|nr:DUF4365 domain-containing protein [Lichenibacterium ramalinae]